MSEMIKRVAIMGAGSIGTVLGALLTRSGVEVDLVDSYAAHVEALRAEGATVTGGVEINVPVRACTPEELTGTYDLVFLLCKQTGTPQALAQMMPHLHESSVVCTLQNGIPEELVSSIVGRERTMGGIVLFGATWTAPGAACCTSPAAYMETGILAQLGEIDGTVTPRLLEVQGILSKAGRCDITEQLMSLRWTKVLLNSAISGLAAVMGCAYGAILDRENAMLALAHIGDEVVKVVHAKGGRMAVMDGHDYEDREILPGQTAADKLAFYHRLWGRTHRELKASMLQDLEKGRPCEIDYINGQVCRGGREHGIPTPYNDMVVALVKMSEGRKTVWTQEETLPLFDALLAAERDH